MRRRQYLRHVRGPPRGLVAGAVENGSATVGDRSLTVAAHRPRRADEYEGRYYHLSTTETGEREPTVYDVRIEDDGDSDSNSDSDSEADPGDETPGSAVDDGSLPAVPRVVGVERHHE